MNNLKKLLLTGKDKIIKLGFWLNLEFSANVSTLTSHTRNYRRIFYWSVLFLTINQGIVELDRYTFMDILRERDELEKLQKEQLIDEIEGLENITFLDFLSEKVIDIKGKYSIIYDGNLTLFLELRKGLKKQTEENQIDYCFILSNEKDKEMIKKLMKVEMGETKFIEFPKDSPEDYKEIFKDHAILFNPEGKPISFSPTYEKFSTKKFMLAIAKETEARYLKKINFSL